jgi:anaerobic magnesium-protoporphyrin IX monomethyl ester cyclase
MKLFILNMGNEKGENISRDTLYGAWCKGKKVGYAEYPPLALLSINTLLNKNKFPTEFLDAQGEKINHDELLVKYNWEDFDYLITQTSTMTFLSDLKLLKSIKEKNKNIKFIVCGSHVTFMPEKSLDNDVIDYIVKYEPEEIILELLTNENKDSIKGIGYRKDGKIVINPNAEAVNFEETPIIDREPILGIKYYNPLVKEEKWTTIETTRGCPARCTFCTAPYFFGKVIRKRKILDIFEEMKYLKNLGYKEIIFRDEVFTFDKKRVSELCNLLIDNRVKIKWICNGKIGMGDKTLMRLMKKAGCHLILYGVESGSQKILDNIKKDITLEDTRDTFRWAKEIGMETHAHFMIGCPGETEETLKETISFAKELKPTTVAFGILTIYPGTELYDEIKDKLPSDWDGTEAEISKLHTKSFESKMLTDLKPEVIEKYLIKAYKEFYTRPGYLLDRLSNIGSLHEAYTLGKSGMGVLWMVLTKKN